MTFNHFESVRFFLRYSNDFICFMLLCSIERWISVHLSLCLYPSILFYSIQLYFHIKVHPNPSRSLRDQNNLQQKLTLSSVSQISLVHLKRIKGSRQKSASVAINRCLFPRNRKKLSKAESMWVALSRAQLARKHLLMMESGSWRAVLGLSITSSPAAPTAKQRRSPKALHPLWQTEHTCISALYCS